MVSFGHFPLGRACTGPLTVAAVLLGTAPSAAHAVGNRIESAPEGVRVEAISQTLGLIEVSARPQGPTEQPPIIEAIYCGRGSPLTVTMRRDDRGLWVARLMHPADRSLCAAGGEVTLRINRADDTDAPSWTATLSPGVATPDWAKGAVWCQIMPERFNNGSALNDPRQPGTFRPPWNGPWETVTPAELENGWAAAVALGYTLDPDQPGGMLYNLVWHRRYGGDLQGVVDRLDHLSTLGITALYLTPIFHSGSLHKYDATDFRHIDPTLGSTGMVPREPMPDPRETTDPASWRWTDADAYFLGVVLPEARARSMRVIIDGVWNHTGLDFWAFRDAIEHGIGSPFALWFDLRFNEAGRVVGWGAWDKPNGHLPRFARQRDGNLIEPVREHIAAITARWMDPNGDGDPSDGIDGWRLDVAGEIAPIFWKSWRAQVKAINPDAVLIGELWHRADNLLDGDAFDAQMNYPFAYEITGWLALRPAMRSSDLARGLRLAQARSASVQLCQMNLIGSHDVERIWSMMANPGRSYDQGARVFDGSPDYDQSPPNDDAIRRGLLGYALLATLPGSPMVYAGDEFGLRGADDPDNRRPIPWPDRGPYAAADAPRTDLVERIGVWLRLRSDPTIGPILRLGGVRYLTSSDPAVFAFERFLNNRAVLIVVNRSDIPFDAGGLGVVPLALPGQQVSLKVPPMSARWWLIAPEHE